MLWKERGKRREVRLLSGDTRRRSNNGIIVRVSRRRQRTHTDGSSADASARGTVYLQQINPRIQSFPAVNLPSGDTYELVFGCPTAGLSMCVTPPVASNLVAKCNKRRR